MQGKELRYKVLIGLTILLSFTGCVRPIDVEIDDNQSVLVVEGLITDKPGPYEVKLTQTAAYTHEIEGVNFPVSGAVVTLYDDAGNAEVLWEEGNGIYRTSYIQGRPGRSYHITIETMEGAFIESIPETMPYPAEVDSFYYEFIEESPITRAGHSVHLVINDPEETRNYYRWRWQGYYIFHTQFERLAPCPTMCWRYEYDQDYLKVVNDRLFDGNVFDQEIYLVPFFDLGNYLLSIEQYNITASAYEFWKLVDEQVNQSGTVFDPPPSRIRGNLFYPDQPDRNVLGYFQASSITKVPVLLKRRAENSGGYRSGLYRRHYPLNTCCNSLTNSRVFIYNPATWPEGWEMD